ncbi:hypothetical protein RUND412_005150 [Rhizina undulata]
MFENHRPYSTNGFPGNPASVPFSAFYPPNPNPALRPRSRTSPTRPSFPGNTPQYTSVPYSRPLSTSSVPSLAGFSPVINSGPSNFQCDACQTDITYRPRVHCLECRDFDVCSRCYIEKKASRGHQLWHKQQTILPATAIRELKPNPKASFTCDVCCVDLSEEPRVRCLECINYDQCLDCKLRGAVSIRHSGSHRTSVVTDHYEVAPVLMADDGQPTELLVRVVEGIFDYLDAAFAPFNTGFLEPAKLSAFYRKMGMKDEENIGLFSDSGISSQYSLMGCQYLLISPKTDEINARSVAWAIDALDTTPRTPVLTKIGWVRFFIVCTWRAPGIMHFLLQNALRTGAIRKGVEGEVFRLSVPREALPKRALRKGEEVVRLEH